MTLATTVVGQTNSITHSRIQTQGFEYFEGTYSARVYFSELPFHYHDANIQTFYTIVSHDLSGDGSKYSELDFEYMAADKWGAPSDDNKQTMYLTSWNRYVAEPNWQAWKRYWSEQKSYEGWHTLVVSCNDGVNVKYWMDGMFITSMSLTDNDGTSVYHRSPMRIAFANWIWNNVIGDSTDVRKTEMKVDWVLFNKGVELNSVEVVELVEEYKKEGIKRINLKGEVYKDVVTEVEEYEKKEEVKLFPNPANNQVLLMGISEDVIVSVYDSSGKLLFKKRTVKQVLDIQQLLMGVYSLNFNVDKEHYRVKLVKQ